MITYLDSSVLLRVALGQPDQLAEWHRITRAITCALTRVECLRTIDRRRLRLRLPDEEVAELHRLSRELLAQVDIIALTPGILLRAAAPSPTSLGTLDAIHLAAANALRERREPELVFATHDTELVLAARAYGFAVVGG